MAVSGAVLSAACVESLHGVSRGRVGGHWRAVKRHRPRTPAPRTASPGRGLLRLDELFEDGRGLVRTGLSTGESHQTFGCSLGADQPRVAEVRVRWFCDCSAAAQPPHSGDCGETVRLAPRRRAPASP